MSIAVEGFDWEEGNETKCQKHGVTLEEIEGFFQTQIYVAPDIKHSQDEDRFLAVGRLPSGRPLFVAFTLRNNLIRPISARYMHEKEAQQYEQISPQNDQ
ncbi:unknown [Crocosphaera subtropica ATCC 51142]|uniref:BrnT family toxin n=1 Tax=Crocosphaera subtropica (strain ATCC 51142 / BH68) TaxID=43989 RepID=B1X2F2_CROS5|nr:BrnT family toxin [Crocosphaera subtropica]ACB54313.1 unknown [Crocosphaera subtropica ATCC 51142]